MGWGTRRIHILVLATWSGGGGIIVYPKVGTRALHIILPIASQIRG